MPGNIRPNDPIVDYPNQAVILDTVLVETTSNKLGTYVPREPGSPFPEGTHTAKQAADFAGAEFLGQKATSDREWMEQHFGKPPSTQDIANWEEGYAEESDAHPVFQRRYLEKRDAYAKRAALTALPGLYRIAVTGAVTVFPTPPIISFSGGTGSGASAIAVLDKDGKLAKITLKTEGSYTVAPAVVIAGAAGGDTAVASLQSTGCVLVKESAGPAPFPYDSLYLAVTRIYETLPGPILESVAWDEEARVEERKFRQKIIGNSDAVISAALATVPVGGTYQTASIIASNVVGGLFVGDPGSGYAALPALTIDPSPGAGTQATGSVNTLKAVSAVPAALGSGYVAGDTITFTGGTFTAAAVATVATVTLSTLALNAAGTGYNPNDVITLQGGSAQSAATLLVNTTTLVSLALVAAGTGMAPGGTLTLVGGAFNTAATLSVTTTKVVSATIAAGGSGGTDGTKTVTGTTGTGTKFQASVTVAGGAITAVLSISLAGSYTVNPTDITAEPVTGASLAGAQLSVVMGVATFSIAGGGAYTLNATTFTSTGGGGDATFNTGVFGVGTFTITSGGNYTATSATFSQQSVTPVGGLGATFQTATFAVAALTISTAGAYTVLPGNPTAQGSSSGAGTGLTAVLSFGIGTVSLTNAGTLYYYTPNVTLSFGNAQVLALPGPLVVITSQTGYIRSHGYEPIDANTGYLTWMASPTPPTIVYYWLSEVSIPLLIFGIQFFLTCNKAPVQSTYNIAGGNSQLRRKRRTISYSETAPSGSGNTYLTKEVRNQGRAAGMSFAFNNALCDTLAFAFPLTDGDCTYVEQFYIPPTVPSASGFAGNWYTQQLEPRQWKGNGWKTTQEEFLG